MTLVPPWGSGPIKVTHEIPANSPPNAPWLKRSQGACGEPGPPAEATTEPPAEKVSTSVQDPVTGRFVAGHGGRKRKGSRNKVTLAIENLLEGEGERIGRKCIDLALAGDPTALKLVMDRVAPVRKGRPLPQIDVKKDEGKIEALLRAVLAGEITPDEGQSVVSLIESAARVQVAYALEQQRRHQLEALRRASQEGHLAGGVMLVPVADLGDWETLAVEAQRSLKAKVRE